LRFDGAGGGRSESRGPDPFGDSDPNALVVRNKRRLIAASLGNAF
jgi:hypothetical protein